MIFWKPFLLPSSGFLVHNENKTRLTMNKQLRQINVSIFTLANHRTQNHSELKNVLTDISQQVG